MSAIRILGVCAVPLVAVAFFAACGNDEGEAGGPNGGLDGSADGRPPPERAEFGLDSRPANPTCKAPPRPPSTAPVSFQRVYQNLNLGGPMVMAQRPGDGSRWYVARRGGSIAHFPSQNPTALTDAANLTNNSLRGAPGFTDDGEGGLLGLVFHPKFAQNGKAYVSFTAPPTAGGSMSSVIAELTSTNGGDTFTSYKTILRFEQPNATNHKGGGLAFGKDGYLYASFGDGGGGDDPFLNGQKKTGFFSKVLRIDIDNPAGGQNYGIPNDNPFKNGGGEPATFAYGFRNPFRISIDRESGELWVGDVGQNQYEEIDHVKLGGNYGWPCREGLHDYLTNAQKCPSKTNLKDPVVEHRHVPNNSRSITGGVVYRGKAVPAFVGTYVYGDHIKQELWGISFDAGTGEAKSVLLNENGGPTANWVSFAEDVDGEVYAVSLNGQMHKLVAAAGGPPDTFPDLLSKTGCVDAADAKRPASGLVPYGVNAELWSDGADKERFLALPDGKTITVNADGDFDAPIGSVIVKSFKIGGRYVETRLLVRHDDGGWAGYTYEWNEAQTDAALLRSSKTKSVGAQSWYFPSRSECVRCHTEAAGRTLGLELAQLNGDFVYGGTNRIANQLTTLEHIAIFAAPLGKPSAELAKLPDVFGADPVDKRARSYLHANCSHCHRPEGGGRGEMDLRFTQDFKATKTCNVDPESGDLDVAGAKLVVPGDPAKSLVSIRPHAAGANRMPPLASSVVDTKGLDVVDGWIRGLTACP